MKKFSGLFVYVIILTGCSLAPTYHRPQMAIPAVYKETKDWHIAKPYSANALRGNWWEIFDDPALNQLESKVNKMNQNVAAALARYEQACAVSMIARSNLFPIVDGIANAGRTQTSKTVANRNTVTLFNDFLIGAPLSYEIDVFGRVKNTVAAADNLTYASAADLDAVKLSMHATLASDYFALCGYEAAQNMLDKIVIAYQKAFDFIHKRHRGGIAAGADEDLAMTQLDDAKTIATDMRLKSAQMRHAIAILAGVAPANLILSSACHAVKFIAVPPSLPSTLLERRPDIAAAERRVIAANAEIGVARAAFFPKFNLAAAIGYESAALKNLIEKPSLTWSLGPTNTLSLLQPLAQVTLFDGGGLQGQLNQAKSAYVMTVANYRQTVLTAFQEVEDNLAAERRYAEEYATQSKAASASKRALLHARTQYKVGTATIFDVVLAENSFLQNQLSALNIKYQRQITAVQLIKALGGGWQTQYASSPLKLTNGI